MFKDAFTILRGSSVTFIAGFNKWNSQLTGNTVTSVASGVSPAIIWPVVDSAVALGFVAASVACVSLLV